MLFPVSSVFQFRQMCFQWTNSEIVKPRLKFLKAAPVFSHSVLLKFNILFLVALKVLVYGNSAIARVTVHATCISAKQLRKLLVATTTQKHLCSGFVILPQFSIQPTCSKHYDYFIGNELLAIILWIFFFFSLLYFLLLFVFLVLYP